MPNLWKAYRVKILDETRAGKPEIIGNVLKRMLFADYYEEIEADQVNGLREIKQDGGKDPCAR